MSEKGYAAGGDPLIAPIPRASSVHGRRAVLVGDDHVVADAGDRHVQGGVAIAANSNALPAKRGAVHRRLSGDPNRQIVGRNQVAHALPPAGGPSKVYASTLRRRSYSPQRLVALQITVVTVAHSGAPRPYQSLEANKNGAEAAFSVSSVRSAQKSMPPPPPPAIAGVGFSFGASATIASVARAGSSREVDCARRRLLTRRRLEFEGPEIMAGPPDERIRARLNAGDGTSIGAPGIRGAAPPERFRGRELRARARSPPLPSFRTIARCLTRSRRPASRSSPTVAGASGVCATSSISRGASTIATSS